MKPTQELVWALRRAAKRIMDQAEGYNWFDWTRCNCGLLAREVCGLSAVEIADLHLDSGGILRFGGTWKDFGGHCHVSGLPFSVVFETLREIGFEQGDYEFIEGAGGATAAEKMSPEYVRDFFLRLANELESKLPTFRPASDPPCSDPSERGAMTRAETDSNPRRQNDANARTEQSAHPELGQRASGSSDERLAESGRIGNPNSGVKAAFPKGRWT